MNLFYKTYGFDVFSLFLLFLSIILNFNQHTRRVSFLIIIITIFRAFSKNINKRSAENAKFISLANKILFRFNKKIPYNIPRVSLEIIPILFSQIKYALHNFINYKIIKCPNCGQKLRLPRRQHKIIVTCKRCKFEFKART
ncbi:MAG: hypothetical protein E7214_12745 [Clostridium sp.]|nr:hypothetical protein [Clostridium sp.]